jgi:hypothetical protein
MTDITIPNLAGVATANLVEQIGTGKFSASYINWSRTMALLREHAPGWQPEMVTAPDGYVLHQAPVGAYLLIRFRNGEVTTPPVPQAIMDTRNAAIPVERITARDITDTHRRGVCMAAAFTFGLAYELWAKLPLESGYAEPEAPKPQAVRHRPVDGAAVAPDRKTMCEEVARAIQHRMETQDIVGAFGEWEGLTDPDEKTYAWSFLDAQTRKALKNHRETLKQAA